MPPDFTQVQPSRFTKTHIILMAIAAICVVGILGGFGFLFIKTLIDPEPITPDAGDEYGTAIYNLENTFRDLASRVETESPDAIIATLDSRAQTATNVLERGALLLSAAQIIVAKDIVAGTARFKAIAADETLPGEIRSSALVSLFLMYETKAVDRDILTAAIFTEESPYGDMQPRTRSDADEMSAYASLLIYADSLHASAITNAYVAHYLARTTYLESETGTSSEALTNAGTHKERANWLLTNTAVVPLDITRQMSRVQLGVADLYLADEDAELRKAITDISLSITEFYSVLESLTSQYDGPSISTQYVDTATDPLGHALWIDILTAAVDIKDTNKETATQLADLYAAFITSESGAPERAIATVVDADVAPLIRALTPLSEPLTNAL